MKRIFIVHSAKFIGGGEKCSLTICSNLESKHEFFILSPVSDISEQMEKTQHYSLFPQLPSLLNSFSYCFSQLNFFLLSLLKKPQIVHCADLVSYLFVSPIAKLLKIKIILHAHYDFDQEFLSWALRKGARVNHLIYCCNYIKFSFRRKVPDIDNFVEKSSVIYNTTSPLSQGKLNLVSFDEEFFHIGIVGNLSKLKGHEVFLNAAAIVEKSNIKCKFHIVGGDSSNENRLEYLTSFAKRLELSNVVFYGNVSDGKEYIKRLNVLVNTSLLEAFPITILEAFENGIPVIAPNINGIPEIVSHGINGFLFNSGNYQECADHIINLLSNKIIYEKMTIESKLTFDTSFNNSIFSANIESIYDNI